jgi:hypothetical protein
MRRALFALAISMSLVARPTGLRAEEGEAALRERIREKVQQMIKEELIKQGQLDDQAAQRVSRIWDEHHKIIWPLRVENMKAHTELRALLVQPQAKDEARINELNERILANRLRITQLEHDRGEAIRAAITPVQYARILVTMPKMMREIMRTVRRASRPAGLR